MANKKGNTTGAGRKPGCKSLINRALLNKAISDKEFIELIKKYYITAYNGNERAMEFFIEQKIGKAPLNNDKDTGTTVNIFDLLKKK